jgi:hypothetical protein
MQTADPLVVLLESLPAEHYGTFVAELNDAITDVCAMVRNPAQAGRSIQALTELIRAWHLTVALRRDESWVQAMNEQIDPLAPNDVGCLDDVRELLAS